ncbi:glycosyl transferase family 2 [Pseudoduganella lurida]|uniref:Glycosyl transferase family 2 n=1 Tax=Pseudoduganella lurida TaxID=1036180 RepID=A0A562RLJ0_9BURK|nr:glycosyltransferase family 2 protein [Pseudoduganella lurida]TWI69763.1 glycosyl transferase family 2 [Pseudoduganella lurida]
MIGIAVPAHDEEASLPACLAALLAAACHPALEGEPVVVCIVLDACADGSEAVVRQHQAAFRAAGVVLAYLPVDERRVGAARAVGAEWLLARGARWLAFTDADTRVAPGWLAAQLALDADAACGTVAVDDWSPHRQQAAALREHFATVYHDRDGHHHIHGANLGVSAEAYRKAGGFSAVTCHEDVLLVKALEAAGARLAWTAQPRVFTSARTDARARGGFGDTLLTMLGGTAPCGSSAA